MEDAIEQHVDAVDWLMAGFPSRPLWLWVVPAALLTAALYAALYVGRACLFAAFMAGMVFFGVGALVTSPLWITVWLGSEWYRRQEEFEVVGTGHVQVYRAGRFYVGTVMDEPFVWHVFATKVLEGD